MRKFIIRKSSIQNLLLFLSVLVSVLFSKTVYFGIINRNSFQYIFYIIILISLIVCRVTVKKSVNKIILFLPFFILFLINILFFKNAMDQQQINQIIGFILIFFFSASLSCLIPVSKFSKYYIKIVLFISLISLISWSIANIDEELALSFCQPGYDWKTTYGYSYLYTWGINGVITLRNSGPFWEPGAFQGFLIIGVLMLLFNCDNNTIKHKKLYMVVFILTLLTTQSTTGYILLLIIILTQGGRITDIFKNINSTLKIIFVLFIIFGTAYIIFSSNNITDKFTGTNRISSELRINDINGGLSMIKDGGLFGLGETQERDFLRISNNVNENDSVGIFSMTYTYGILFSIYYMVLMIFSLKSFFSLKKTRDFVLLLLIFLTLHMTEGLWFLPVFLYFIFSLDIKDTKMIKGAILYEK